MTYHAMRLPGAKFGIADGRSSSIPSAALPFRKRFAECVPKALMHFGRACFLRNRQKHPSNLVRQSSAIATAWGERIHGTQTGMLHGIPWSARCVQRFDDSRNSAIHITYRVSLRSSSMGEPRDPLSKVVLLVVGQLRSNDFHVHTTIRVW